MRTFRISEHLEAVCEYKKTRMAFKHEAHLFRDGQEIGFAKICYQNRTWESYDFQSVLFAVVRKADKELSEEEKKICKNFIEVDHTDWSGFKAVGIANLMGDLICQTPKEKNDWKEQMIKTIPGIEIPEDWKNLSEEERTKRLDLATELIAEVGGKHE